MEKINAVEMVRKIRDKQYEETKKMSRADLLKFYKRNGEKALAKASEKLSFSKGYTLARIIKDILQGALRDSQPK